MNFEQIKKALSDQEYTWRTAADAMGKSPTALQQVAKRNIKGRYVALGICALIGKKPNEVFPDVPEYQEEDPKTKRQNAVARAKAALEAAGLQVA